MNTDASDEVGREPLPPLPSEISGLVDRLNDAYRHLRVLALLLHDGTFVDGLLLLLDHAHQINVFRRAIDQLIEHADMERYLQADSRQIDPRDMPFVTAAPSLLTLAGLLKSTLGEYHSLMITDYIKWCITVHLYLLGQGLIPVGEPITPSGRPYGTPGPGVTPGY